MVLRRAYDTINTVGQGWVNLNQGTYTGPTKTDRHLEQARALLEEVVADWPEGVPETRAVTAARSFIRRTPR